MQIISDDPVVERTSLVVNTPLNTHHCLRFIRATLNLVLPSSLSDSMTGD